MEYTALWGPKGFIISPSKIVPLMNLATSFSVKSTNANDTSGTSATNARGRELQKISLSTLYVRSAGVDPRGQIAEWQAVIGQSYPLYIEGQRFGPPKLTLKSVDVSDVLLSNTGKFLQCAIAVNFEEYTEPSATKSVATTSGTGNTSSASAARAAETYNSIVAKEQEEKKQNTKKREALNATAKPLDRAAKKPNVKVEIR